MTLEVGFLLAVLAAMVTLFLTEKLPIDLTAVAEVAGVAATAVMMPAVASIERGVGFRRPGLFMPLSFGVILGGTTTLVGGMRRLPRDAWDIVKEARRDNLTGESAKVAYYFFLSIWPLFLGLFAFTGIFGGQPAFEWIMGWIQDMLPEQPTRFLERYVREITEESRPDMLSLGVILTIWSGSNIFAALGDGLNTMYDIEEGRSWWKRRAMAVLLLVLASVLLTAGATAILAGEAIIEGFGLADVYNVARWPIAFVVLTALLWLVYYWLPDRPQAMSRKYVTIGAVVGSTLWVLVTTLFRLYVAHFGSYGETYGLVGGIIVMLIWFYLTALTILFGGEVAVSLEQGIHRDREAPIPRSTACRGAGGGRAPRTPPGPGSRR